MTLFFSADIANKMLNTAKILPEVGEEDKDHAVSISSPVSSVPPVDQGLRYAEGQIIRTILPMASESLLQLCKVQGFDQRLMLHDVKRLHDNGCIYDSQKRALSVDLAKTPHVADTVPLNLGKSWTMLNYGTKATSGLCKDSHVRYLRDIVWGQPHMKAGIYWICELRMADSLSVNVENFIFKEAQRAAAIERKEKLTLWKMENAPPNTKNDEHIRQYQIKLNQQEEALRRHEVTTRNR